MNQNTNLRFAALSLSAVLLTAALTACGGSGGRNTTTTGTTSASSTTTSTSDTRTNNNGTETGTGTGTGINGGVDGILNGNGSGSGGSTNNGNGNATGSGGVIDEMIPDLENVDLANAVVRFNGSDYRVSGEEELRRDEIGVQLLVVEQTVDKLENDGDATGLPAGVKVWSIKDNTDYSAVAVEIDGMYYRASKQAD